MCHPTPRSHVSGTSAQVKFLVFPFFIPCVFAWVVYMFVKLNNAGRAAFAAFLAMQASVFYQMEERATAQVGSWGLQGPCKDCPIPSLGVWYFQGLPGAGFIDFSHCEWTGEGGLLTPKNTAYCHMPGLIGYPKEGYNILAEQRRLGGARWLDVTADFGSAGAPAEAFFEIAPWHLNMGLLFYRKAAPHRTARAPRLPARRPCTQPPCGRPRLSTSAAAPRGFGSRALPAPPRAAQSSLPRTVSTSTSTIGATRRSSSRTCACSTPAYAPP